ncbi:hypothetical protein [Stenotrophomonas sp.]|uniref:hypothetical protein n=1 Tax=Stenotrophomonas sp. TaxID=69392 RepID=UPI00289AE831|nr:hypothetical protein [Stenotrophomonas sp.]
MNNVNQSHGARSTEGSDAERTAQKGQGQENGEELGGGADGKDEKGPQKQKQQSGQEGGRQGGGKDEQGEQRNAPR